MRRRVIGLFMLAVFGFQAFLLSTLWAGDAIQKKPVATSADRRLDLIRKRVTGIRLFIGLFTGTRHPTRRVTIAAVHFTGVLVCRKNSRS